MKTVKIEGKVYVNSRASAVEPPQSITASIFNVVGEEVMITEIGIENGKRTGVTEGDVICQTLTNS